MASMGFNYAQIHVRQEMVQRRISKEVVTTTMKSKSMTEEEKKKYKSSMAEVEKPVCDSRATQRVHPCASSTAPASPAGGHR
jgi:hypothetical protein